MSVSVPRRRGALMLSGVLCLLALFIIQSPARADAQSVAYEPVLSPLWAPGEGNYLVVTTDFDCHVYDCDGYGNRVGGQDVVMLSAEGLMRYDAAVMTPVVPGRNAIITRIWTDDGCYQNIADPRWYCYGHGYGNAIDLYVGQHPEYGPITYRYAHMSSDGFWFYHIGPAIYSYYDPGDVLPYGYMLGYIGNTGNSGATHLHWELLMGAQRFIPTTAWLDIVDMTYAPHGAIVDAVRHVCTVTPFDYCWPEPSAMGIFQEGEGAGLATSLEGEMAPPPPAADAATLDAKGPKPAPEPAIWRTTVPGASSGG